MARNEEPIRMLTTTLRCRSARLPTGSLLAFPLEIGVDKDRRHSDQDHGERDSVCPLDGKQTSQGDQNPRCHENTPTEAVRFFPDTIAGKSPRSTDPHEPVRPRSRQQISDRQKYEP